MSMGDTIVSGADSNSPARVCGGISTVDCMMRLVRLVEDVDGTASTTCHIQVRRPLGDVLQVLCLLSDATGSCRDLARSNVQGKVSMLDRESPGRSQDMGVNPCGNPRTDSPPHTRYSVLSLRLKCCCARRHFSILSQKVCV